MQSNALSWVVAYEPTNGVAHIRPFDGLSCLFGFELMASAQMRSNGSKREYVHRAVFKFMENVRADGSMAFTLQQPFADLYLRYAMHFVII